MSTPFRPSNPPEVFVSYAHKDEDLFEKFEPFLAELERRGIIRSWHGRKMSPGDDWQREISDHLESAQIFLLMVSVHFLISDYCIGVEFKRAMERHALGEAQVMPVILHPCKWKETPLVKFLVLPKGAKPVGQWDDIQDAFVDIADGITQVVKRLDQASRSVQVEQEHRLHIEPRAIAAVPDIRYVLGVAGIAVVVAIVAGFRIDYKIAVFASLLMFALMLGTVGLSFRVRSAPSLRPLLWILFLLTAFTSLSIISGFYILWLRPFGPYVDFPQPTPSVTPVSTPSPGPSAPPQSLQIVMDEVPPFDPVGGVDSNARIAGRVMGAKSGEYVLIIYSLTTVSKTKTWYVQPTEKDTETEINSDSSWSAEIHTGTNYAVLLVPRNYQPPPHTSKSPIRLPGVITSIEFEGKR